MNYIATLFFVRDSVMVRGVRQEVSTKYVVTKGLVQSTFGPDLHLRWFVNGHVFYLFSPFKFMEDPCF